MDKSVTDNKDISCPGVMEGMKVPEGPSDYVRLYRLPLSLSYESFMMFKHMKTVMTSLKYQVSLKSLEHLEVPGLGKFVKLLAKANRPPTTHNFKSYRVFQKDC